MIGLANFRVVGKPEVINGLRGQVLVSRVTGDVVLDRFHFEGNRVYQDL
jgi:hypothetical protein